MTILHAPSSWLLKWRR